MHTTKTSLIFLAGGILLVLASLKVGNDFPPNVDAPITGLSATGILIGAIAGFSFRSTQLASSIEGFLQYPSKWLGIPTWGFALICLSLPFSILAHYAAGDTVLMYSPIIGWTAWLLSILVIMLGAWRYDGRIHLLQHRNLLITAVGLFALAFLLRVFRPEEYPLIFSGNEGSVGLVGMDILAGKFNNPFASAWFSFPGLYFFIPAGSLAVFGHTLTALRIPSILAGALMVPLTYLLGRAMYGRQVAIMAALLLAGFHIHIHFSRLGLSNAWDGLFFIVVIALVWYAWEHEKRNLFLLAGLSLGLAQYLYVTSRILLILIPVWLFIAARFDRARFKRLAPDLMLMLLVTVAVILPLAWFYVDHPQDFLDPIFRASALSAAADTLVPKQEPATLAAVLEKLWLGAQSFTHLPIWSSWYPTGEPFLAQPLATLFLAGVVFLAFGWRENRNILMLLWLIPFIFVGGFSQDPPSPQRYVAVMPACMLAAAFGLTRVVQILSKFLPKIGPYANSLAMLAIVLLSVKDTLDYYTYFTRVTRLYWSQSDGMIAQELGQFLQTQPEDTQVVFFGYPRMNYYSIPSTQFLVPHIEALDVVEPWGSEKNPQPDSEHVVFVFLPPHRQEIPKVQADYPGGTLLEERSYWNQVLYYYYIYSE
jgi:hypothetical protein